MFKPSIFPVIGAILAVSLLLSACGGGATPTPTATALPLPSGDEFLLSIEEPFDIESIVDESSIEVVGRTRVDAVVSVGNDFAEIDEDGRFRVPVQLEEGPNIIEVVASLESGEELVEILVVIYSP